MIRGNLYWALLVSVSALVEVTWLRSVRIGDVVPDLVLLLVVYFAMTSGPERAMFTGLLGGIFQDVAADTGLGHHVFALVLAGYVGGMLANRLIMESPAVKAGMVLCACLVNGLAYVAIDFIQNPEMNVVDAILVSMIPRTFYTMLVTPLVFIPLDRLLAGRLPTQRRAA